jgi:hypothetical protein
MLQEKQQRMHLGLPHLRNSSNAVIGAPSPSLSIAVTSHHAGLGFLVGAGESGLKNPNM